MATLAAALPHSAALFFGNVIVSVGAGSTVTLPLLYGVGTALPVIVFAVLIALGSPSDRKHSERCSTPSAKSNGGHETGRVA